MTKPRPVGYACGTDRSEAPTRSGVSPREAQRSGARRRQGIGALHSTVEAGEPNLRGAGGGKESPGRGIVGGKHGRCIGTGSRVHETTANSGAGEASTADGIYLPQPPPRSAVAGRGFRSNPQRRCPGCVRADGRRLRGVPAGQPRVAAGTSQVRHLSGTARAAGAHSKGNGDRNPAPRDPDAGG
jgi:hypothetical protein